VSLGGLNFGQDNSSAEGVHGAAGKEDVMAGLGGSFLKRLFDLVRRNGVTKARTDRYAASGLCNHRARLGIDDVPRLGFQMRSGIGRRVGRVGMHLDGKIFAGVEKFNQDRELAMGRNDGDVAVKRRPKIAKSPHAVSAPPADRWRSPS